MPLKTASYQLHSASGQAIVRFMVNGRRRTFCLGPYDSPKSKERYQQILTEFWEPAPTKRPGEWPTLEELMAAYLTHCKRYYSASNETEIIKLAMWTRTRSQPRCKRHSTTCREHAPSS